MYGRPSQSAIRIHDFMTSGWIFTAVLHIRRSSSSEAVRCVLLMMAIAEFFAAVVSIRCTALKLLALQGWELKWFPQITQSGCRLAEHIFLYSSAIKTVWPRWAHWGSAVRLLQDALVQPAWSRLNFSVSTYCLMWPLKSSLYTPTSCPSSFPLDSGFHLCQG